MCVCVRMCVCVPRRERGGGLVHQTEHTGDLWVGGGCLVGGTLAGDGGTTELAAVSAFFGTLYRTNEQRSEPHFYTLLGTLPCQSFPPLAPEWVFFSFFFLSPPPTIPCFSFSIWLRKTDVGKTKCALQKVFFFFFKGCVYIGLNCDGFSSAP